MDELVRRWQRGWGLCRGLPPARLLDGDGLEVVLGLPGRERELFALSDEPAAVRRLVAGAGPDTWVTVTTTDREGQVAAELTELGFDVFAERKALMTIALANHPTAAAGPGYRVEFETVASPDRAEPAGPEHGVERAAGAAEHGVERAAEYGAEPAAGAAEHGVERGVAAAEYGVVELVRVVDEAGGVAARGMVGVVGMDAVMHDIHTEPAHRRRGLGSVVMAALSRRAVERGATTGLLMATYDGVQLYRRLEWLPRATMLTGSGLRAAGTEGGDLRPVLASR